MDQDTENRVERRRRRRRGIVALLGAISMLTIGAGSISLAQFTDTAGATWNFTAGTIDISVNPTAFAAINPMMPGDVNTQPLTVTNGGTAQLRYAMSTTATNALGTAIQLTVKTEDAGGGCAAFTGTTVVAATNLNGAAFGSSAPGRPGRRPDPGRRRQRGPVLPGQPPAGRSGQPPGRDLGRRVHVQRRADRQQPVTRRLRLHHRLRSASRGGPQLGPSGADRRPFATGDGHGPPRRPPRRPGPADPSTDRCPDLEEPR